MMSEKSTNNVCEERTFQKLFDTLAEPIRNFILYRGGEEQQAMDLVQESFIKLWENCKKVSPQKAKSYLYTLASNAFKNEMAHLKVRLKYVEAKKDDQINLETPEFNLQEKEFEGQLNLAIASMVPTQREVFLMNRIEKMKYAEIAEMLGVSVKAVEKRMGKALKYLRATIKEFQ